ncbi:MAG: hypothetical protein RL653_931 [Pseudomonadota bacterium]
MNLLLLEPHEVQPDGTATLAGRRLAHAREVLQAQAGDALRVGMRAGRLGTGRVVRLDTDALVLSVTLDTPPPERPGVDILLAIPRPKQLKRVLQTVASLGVDRLVLVNAARVEKSYFQSHVLAPDAVQDFFSQGLEQARDTRSPELLLRERFRPFVEDEAPSLFPDTLRLLPHPPEATPLAALPRPEASRRVVLAIGPEGGWVPFEVELLRRAGFQPFSLGARILRTEVALPVLLGQLAAWRHLPATPG